VIQIKQGAIDSSLRIFWLMLFAAAVSALYVAIDALYGHVKWTNILTGTLVVLAGLQLAAARSRIAGLAPESARPWMKPLTYFLYAAGFLFIVLGVNALANRGVAP
jgi:hypothetical protein